MSKKSKHSRNLVKLGKKQFICKCLVQPSKSKCQKKHVTQELKQYHSTITMVPQDSEMSDVINQISPENDGVIEEVLTDMIPCNKEFTCISNLIVHQRIHSGTKPFECPQCHKKFASSGNMQDHMNRHTNTKPYACGQCDQKFYRLNLLKTHQKKCHHTPQILVDSDTQTTIASCIVDVPPFNQLTQKSNSENNGKVQNLLDLKSDISTEEQSNSRASRAYTEESQAIEAKISENDQESDISLINLPNFDKFKKVMDYNKVVLSIIGWNSGQQNQIQTDQKMLSQFLFPAVRRVITPIFTKNQPPCKYY